MAGNTFRVPDVILLQVVTHLSPRDLKTVSLVCKQAERVAVDFTIWKPFLQTMRDTPENISIRPGNQSYQTFRVQLHDKESSPGQVSVGKGCNFRTL